MPKYKYEVGGKTYLQKPLVLGQIKQLIGALGNIELPVSRAADLDAGWLLAIIGDRLPHVMAVVLIEEGVSIQEKNLDVLAAEIESTFDIETTVRVVEDFFDCNPAASILERLIKVAENVMPPGSTRSASSSAGETSPSGTPSSGALQ